MKRFIGLVIILLSTFLLVGCGGGGSGDDGIVIDNLPVKATQEKSENSISHTKSFTTQIANAKIVIPANSVSNDYNLQIKQSNTNSLSSEALAYLKSSNSIDPKIEFLSPIVSFNISNDVSRVSRAVLTVDTDGYLMKNLVQISIKLDITITDWNNSCYYLAVQPYDKDKWQYIPLSSNTVGMAPSEIVFKVTHLAKSYVVIRLPKEVEKTITEPSTTDTVTSTATATTKEPIVNNNLITDMILSSRLQTMIASLSSGKFEEDLELNICIKYTGEEPFSYSSLEVEFLSQNTFNLGNSIIGILDGGMYKYVKTLITPEERGLNAATYTIIIPSKDAVYDLSKFPSKLTVTAKFNTKTGDVYQASNPLVIAFSKSGPTNVFAKGSGSEKDPYLVNTVEELGQVRNYPEYCYKQTSDIDVGAFILKRKDKSLYPDDADTNSDVGWLPIGDSSKKFKGLYDGNGYQIKGLKINRPQTDNVGLFGYVSGARIFNVILDENTDIIGKNNVGGIVGNTGLGTAIKNCKANGGKILSNNDCVAGIVGYASQNCLIEQCVNHADILSLQKESSVGGIAGKLLSDSSTKNCINYATINSCNENVGGIIGLSEGSIYDCINYGNIIGGYNIGGICGKANNITISFCANGGNIIEPYAYGGGVCGYGGGIRITGCNNSARILSLGKFTESFGGYQNQMGIGGLVGYAAGGSVNNSFNIGSLHSEYTYESAGINLGNAKVDNCYVYLENGEIYSKYNAAGIALGKGIINHCYFIGKIAGDIAYDIGYSFADCFTLNNSANKFSGRTSYCFEKGFDNDVIWSEPWDVSVWDNLVDGCLPTLKPSVCARAVKPTTMPENYNLMHNIYDEVPLLTEAHAGWQQSSCLTCHNEITNMPNHNYSDNSICYSCHGTNGLPDLNDSTLPILSNISANPTYNSVTVTWNSDKDCVSRLILKTAEGDRMEFPVSTTYTTSHKYTVTGLQPNTTYFFEVTCTDKSGSKTSSSSFFSSVMTFKTSATPEGIITPVEPVDPVDSEPTDAFIKGLKAESNGNGQFLLAFTTREKPDYLYWFLYKPDGTLAYTDDLDVNDSNLYRELCDSYVTENGQYSVKIKAIKGTSDSYWSEEYTFKMIN